MFTRKDQQLHCVRAFMRGGKKQVQIVELSTRLPDKVRMFSTHTLVPGASIGFHTHWGETELVYFMEGVCRVQDDDQVYYASAGDSMVVTSGHSHGMENIGDSDVVLVCTIIKD